MINLLPVSLILGILAAYVLHNVTKHLLIQYNTYEFCAYFYYAFIPILLLLLGLTTPTLISYLLGATFLCILTLTAVLDYYTFEVRHRFILLIALLSVLQYCFVGTLSIREMSIGFFASSLPLLLISLFTHGSIGGGDIKLLASCGLVLGYANILLGTFLGIVLGGFYGILLITLGNKEKKDHLPFVPLLAIGLSLAYLWGTPLLNWYLGLFILRAS